MKFRDSNLQFARQLLVPQVTLSRAEYLVESRVISERDYHRYCRLWRWSAVRHTGTASCVQDVFLAKRGMAGLYSRLQRVKQVIDALREAAKA